MTANLRSKSRVPRSSKLQPSYSLLIVTEKRGERLSKSIRAHSSLSASTIPAISDRSDLGTGSAGPCSSHLRASISRRRMYERRLMKRNLSMSHKLQSLGPPTHGGIGGSPWELSPQVSSGCSIGTLPRCVIHCTKPQLPGFHRAERYAEKVPAVR